MKKDTPEKPSRLVYAENLSAAMDRLGLTDSAVGQRVGVSRVTVWRWRTGKQEPLGDYRDQLAKVVGSTVHRLYRAS